MGVGAFLIILVLYFSLAANEFATASNVLVILATVAIITIISLGQSLAIVSGGFDLSTIGTVPLGAIAFSMFSNDGLNTWYALLATLGIGIAVGLLNGLIITKLGINPLIATLGMSSIAAGLAATLANGVSISFNSQQLNWLGGSIGTFDGGGLPNAVVIAAVLCLVCLVLLKYSVYGRSLYAIGGNREAAWLAGIRIDRDVISVYVASGLLCSLAGAISASQLMTGSTTFGSTSALESIAAVVLGGGSLVGGVGTVGGTLMGVLVLGVLQNGLTLLQVPAFYQEMATGGTLLLAVAFGTLRTRFA
jgi:ribose/xylose/arabinose/galactoside ABC-type transport system permease subunit